MMTDVTNSKKDWDDFWYNSEDNYLDNGILEDGQLPEESYNKEFEITVDPLTHKVIYNAELNEYKVVKREDIK